MKTNHVIKITIKYHVIRLDEDTANRKNNNRLFDSQNNNKGGYNTGDRFTSEGGSRPERFYSMVSVLMKIIRRDFSESVVFLSCESAVRITRNQHGKSGRVIKDADSSPRNDASS